VALPPTIFLNAYPIVCTGGHQLSRIPRPPTREERDALERELGLRFWGRGDYLYASLDRDLPNAEIVHVACEDDTELHLYALRQALRAHAFTKASDVWFGKGGILNIIGLLEPTRHGRALSEVELQLRVATEGVLEPETFLIARTRHRWAFAETLDYGAYQSASIGGTAIRVSGAGPERGEVIRFSGDLVVIRHDEEEHTVAASEYRLRADVALVRQVLGAETLFALQVASGSLATNRRKNQAAIKDRFVVLQRALDALGREIPLPGGGTVRFERDPVEVRVQQAGEHGV
jgi:hypothetical protein